MKSIKLLLLPVALGLGISVASHAQPDHHSPLLKQLRHLELSQTQRQDVRTLLSQWRAERELYAEDKSVLRDIIQATQWDEQAARSALHQLASEDKAWVKAQMQQAIWNLLNEDQQQQWQAMLNQALSQHGPDLFTGPWMKRLNLSAEQKEEVETLRSQAVAHKAEEQALKKAFIAAQLQLMTEGDFNQNSFAALYKQYQPQLETLALDKLMQRHQFYQLLDEEQRRALEQIRHKRKPVDDDRHARLSPRN